MPQSVRDQISHVIAMTVLVRSCSLNSIKQGDFLVARCVSALVNIRVVAVKRNHGGNGGERKDEGQCCDEGLHGWSPLGCRDSLPNNVTLGTRAEIECDMKPFTVIEILTPENHVEPCKSVASRPLSH
jgi:hypothetical protein